MIFLQDYLNKLFLKIANVIKRGLCMEASWVALVPPLLVIAIAFFSRRMLLALFMGIVSALFFVHNADFFSIVNDFFIRILATTELRSVNSIQSLWNASNLCILLFLLFVGIFILLLRVSGGAYAYGEYVSRYLKNKKDAHSASLLFSLFFFIDDYLSSISVGSVMQAVTDRFAIPRVKLAFLVNSMAAPLVVITPVSSWVANITTQLKNAGIANNKEALITVDAFYLYLQAIPYLMYSFLVLVLVWFIIRQSLSFGVIYKHEAIAEKTGNLFAGKSPVMEQYEERDVHGMCLVDFFAPLFFLFTVVAVGMLYFGDWTVFGGVKNIFNALSSTRIAPALCIASITTVLFTAVFLVLRKRISLRELWVAIVGGIQLMFSSVCMLVFAWTLSTLLGTELATGSYLASLVTGKISAWLFPAVFFLLTALTTTLMGSAWGAMSIYIPIAIPMLLTVLGISGVDNIALVPLLLPLVGAIVSGAVVGNHLSPMADNTLMAATSSGAYVIDVFKAQVSFTLPVALITALAYAVLGYIIMLGMQPLMALGIVFCGAVLIGMGYFVCTYYLKQKNIL